MENEVVEFIENANPRFIVGLLGAGFVFAWISELFFSLCALFCEWAIKKIKGIKGDNNDHV